MLEGWSSQSEAVLKTAFDAQNAAFEAGLNLFDLGLKGNRKAVEQFSTIVKRTQQATLESWQSAVKAATMATEATKRTHLGVMFKECLPQLDQCRDLGPQRTATEGT